MKAMFAHLTGQAPRRSADPALGPGYWVDEQAGRVFCLVEAPSADADEVHRQAHGLITDHI